MTEVEPEFDANERDSWEALKEYREAVCPHCGNLRAICSDPDTEFYPQRDVCYASASQAWALRKWHSKHEDPKPDASGFLPTDGTTIWVSTADLTPDDDFL